MKLKEIKPGMVIHCKTGLEAEKLFSVLRNCGIKWLSGDDLMSTFFYEHADTGTCYFIDSENKLSRSSFEYFTNNTGKYGEIIPFSSLVIEEKTYEDGLSEAWAATNKLADMMGDTLNAVFGFDDAELIRQGTTPFGKAMSLTPQEAISKLEAYEAEKQIKVGCIVKELSSESFGVVAKTDKERAYVLWSDGSCGKHSQKDLTKTGKHIDISSILAEIGKE